MPRALPALVVFDVNETLSDMSPMQARFHDVGLPPNQAAAWFAGLLRDGFALTITGANPAFAELGQESLHGLLHGQVDDVDAAVAHVMSGFTQLPLHADVADGIRALQGLGTRLVTLSNGSSAVAEGLVERNGLHDAFERLLSVQDAPAWKPAASAYHYALDLCHVQAADAMLVAVHPWDIHGAREAGMRTAWINRSAGRYPHTMHRPDLEADSLTQLAQLLSPLGRIG
jgi:2-haloacid dehalogenase